MSGSCLDPKRLLALRTAAHLRSDSQGIWIVSSCSYGYLVRGACPSSLVEELLRFAGEHEAEFYAVHGKLKNSIGRILLHASPQHQRELARNNELSAVCTHAKAATLATQLGLAWERTRKVVLATQQEDCGSMIEAEIARALPASPGQVDHLDQLKNAWSMMVCVGRPGEHMTGTRYAEYPYQRYPANVSGESTMPVDWEALPHHYVQWQVGDIMVGRQNHVHGGPENMSLIDYRFVAFMGGSLPPGCPVAQSDAEVWTQSVFWEHMRRYYERGGGI
jgi:hypothetical protein